MTNAKPNSCHLKPFGLALGRANASKRRRMSYTAGMPSYDGVTDLIQRNSRGRRMRFGRCGCGNSAAYQTSDQSLNAQLRCVGRLTRISMPNIIYRA